MSLYSFATNDETAIFATSAEFADTIMPAIRSGGNVYQFARLFIDLQNLRPLNSKGQLLPASEYTVRDYGVWGTFSVFSERARNAIVLTGGEGNDLIRIRHLLDDFPDMFVYLPDKIQSLIDLNTIQSLHTLPLDPPFPFAITFAEALGHTPPIFYNYAPGGKQALGELFASSTLRDCWVKEKFNGAILKRMQRK
jgi:hypothetical protein